MKKILSVLSTSKFWIILSIILIVLNFYLGIVIDISFQRIMNLSAITLSGFILGIWTAEYSTNLKNTEIRCYNNAEYWKNICEIQEQQTQKGIQTYGQTLEENTDLTQIETLTMLEEELIDGLMYIEHIKKDIKV